MRRLLTAATLVALGVIPGATARSSDAPFGPYVSDQGNWAVVSNAQWRVTPTVKARELQPGTVSITAPAGEKTAVVWAPDCARGEQTATFSREIAIPGVPAQATFDFNPVTYPVPLISGAQLLVNGHHALTLSAQAIATQSRGEFQLPAGQLKDFRLGKNELEVIVTKRAAAAAAPACNTGARTNALGVLFGLQGSSAADLSVSPGTAPIQYKRGSVYQLNGSFKVHNAGPSAAFPGLFSFRLQIGFLNGVFNTLGAGVKASTPFGKCETSGGPDSNLSLTCPFSLFPAGETATVSFSTVVKIPVDEPPSNVYQMLADWNIVSHTAISTYAGTNDPKPENNSQSESINLCGPTATDPKCPAKAGG